MQRRDFLQMLGLGGAATALSPDFVQQTNEQMNYGSMIGKPLGSHPMSLGEQIARAKHDYGHFMGIGKADFIRRTIKDWRDDGHFYDHKNVDPDIQDMKSWSKSTKIRVHMERRAELRWRLNEKNMLDRISTLLGMEEKA